MNFKVKNCGKCPFLEMNADYEWGFGQYFCTCLLLKRIGGSNYSFFWTELDEEGARNLWKVLPNCPLKEGEIKISLK